MSHKLHAETWPRQIREKNWKSFREVSTRAFAADFSILARIRTSSFEMCQLSACSDTFLLSSKCRFCSCRTSFAFLLCAASFEVCMFVVVMPALMVPILSF